MIENGHALNSEQGETPLEHSDEVGTSVRETTAMHTGVCRYPAARIARLMKLMPGVRMVSKDSIDLMTELATAFTRVLTEAVATNAEALVIGLTGKQPRILRILGLQDVVDAIQHTGKQFEFLTVPSVAKLLVYKEGERAVRPNEMESHIEQDAAVDLPELSYGDGDDDTIMLNKTLSDIEESAAESVAEPAVIQESAATLPAPPLPPQTVQYAVPFSKHVGLTKKQKTRIKCKSITSFFKPQ